MADTFVVAKEDNETISIHKPGWQTTEFGVVVATMLIGLLVQAGVFRPSDADKYSANITDAVVAVINAIVVIYYSKHRTELKKTVTAVTGNGAAPIVQSATKVTEVKV